MEIIEKDMIDLISNYENGYRYFGYWSSPTGIFGNQFKVYNRDQTVRYLKIWNGVANCGISVSTYRGELPYLLYLPFDFDSKSLDTAWEEAKSLYNEAVDMGLDVYIQYSGFRGFHCMISTEPKLYTKNQMREAQEFFKKELDLKTVDTQLFGDFRRLIRIPGTLHAGKFRKTNGKINRIGEGEYCTSIKHTKGKRFDISKYFEDKYPNFVLNGHKNNNKPSHPFPCVDNILDNYRDENNRREPPQLARYTYVAYWLKMGKTPEEIFNMLEKRHGKDREFEWYDWDSNITMKQINHIARNPNYKPLSCRSLKALGYCNIKDCIYDTENIKLKKVSDLNETEKILLRMW